MSGGTTVADKQNYIFQNILAKLLIHNITLIWPFYPLRVQVFLVVAFLVDIQILGFGLGIGY